MYYNYENEEKLKEFLSITATVNYLKSKEIK